MEQLLNQNFKQIIPSLISQPSSKNNSTHDTDVMESSNCKPRRKSSLKNQNDRKFSENGQRTIKIKSNERLERDSIKKIKFKNEKQFQKFIYFKESSSKRCCGSIYSSYGAQKKDQKCSIM